MLEGLIAFEFYFGMNQIFLGRVGGMAEQFTGVPVGPLGFYSIAHCILNCGSSGCYHSEQQRWTLEYLRGMSDA